MSEMIRTFIAIEMPDVVKKELQTLLAQTKRMAPQLRWVSPDNMHLTLKFLGEITPDFLENVKRACQDVAVSIEGPIKLSLAGLGAFPNFDRPRVIWTAVHGHVESLHTLQSRLESALFQLGCEKEERPFKAHLTLCRIKDVRLESKVKKQLLELQFTSSEFPAREVIVMQSELRPAGPIYSARAVCPFGIRDAKENKERQ